MPPLHLHFLVPEAAVSCMEVIDLQVWSVHQAPVRVPSFPRLNKGTSSNFFSCARVQGKGRGGFSPKTRTTNLPHSVAILFFPSCGPVSTAPDLFSMT
jgi:hypothetical protein